MPSTNLQKLVFSALLAVFTLALGGLACSDKKSASSSTSNVAIVENLDKNAQSDKPAKREPIPGVDTKKLKSDKKIDRFYKLVDELQSPCGKAHALRTSLLQDSSCKRAPFAASYVVEMLSDEQDDEDIRELYKLRFGNQSPPKAFELNETVPHVGPPDATVKLVEFYDYGCPACKQFAPLLDDAIGEFSTQVVMYYKQFPLPGHPQSKPAAQAALAAMKQGKFLEMHKILFANAPRHNKSDLDGYAGQLGLDMARFNADFDSAKARVESDIAEGDKAGIRGTPTLYINGRQYEGLAHPKYIKMWIEEELAVNR